MKLLYLNVILVLLMIPCISQAQNNDQYVNLGSKSLTLDFKDIKYTPFDPARFIFPVKEKNDVTGIPKNLSGYKVLHSFADRNQFFYQSVKDGSMSRSMYDQMEDINEEHHTDQSLDAILSIAIGKEDDQLKLYVDSDNDEDFSNEHALTFRTERINNERSVLVTDGNISVEYFDEGEVKVRQLNVRFILPDSTKYESLSWYVPVFKEGKISANNRDYRVALGAHPTYRSGFYYFFYVDLNGDGKFDTKRGSAESYSLSEPFNLGGVGLKIDNLAQDGSSFSLSQVKEEVLPKTVIKPGVIAPHFETSTINGKPFRLTELRGKYILLDFWESKCPYCIQEIDHLKNASQEFTDKLSIVGIAADTDMTVLKAFLIRYDINWTQISSTLTSELAALYSVYGFPTQFLINPEGIIIETGGNLRGEKLIETLKKHIK